MQPNLQAITLSWSFNLQTWVDYVQLLAWLALLVALVSSLPRLSSLVRRRGDSLKEALLVGGTATVARLIPPKLPVNWYSGIDNVDLGGRVYSKDTSYMPLVNQVITFNLGFNGILIFNSILGVLSALLAWQVAKRNHYGERVALVFGLAVGLIPAYVRFSVSDSTHFLGVPLFLLAALALTNLLTSDRDWRDWVMLSASIVALGAVRVEATLAAPAIIPLVTRNTSGMRQFIKDRRLLVVCCAALLLALACSMGALPGVWGSQLRSLDWPLLILQTFTRLLFIFSIDILGWFPLVAPIFVLYYLIRKAKEGEWEEAAFTALPYWILSIPHVYTTQAIAAELPSHAYGLVLNLLFLLAFAKGVVLSWERLSPRFLSLSKWRQVLITGGALSVGLILLIVPYRMTYQYMHEFGFLQKSLPKTEARIVAFWDPDSPDGDFDCCLALPYPTFVKDFPGLRWYILSRDNFDEELIRNLEFDYYYPGSLVELHLESFHDWLIGRLVGIEPEMSNEQQKPIRELKEMDQRFQQLHRLEVAQQATVPANTFSFAPFLDDRATLTLYRKVD